MTGQTITNLVEEQEDPIHKNNKEVKKSAPQQMNLKPKATTPNTSTALLIPSEISADLQVLDEKVKSMMEKSPNMIQCGKQTIGGAPMRATLRICKVCHKEGLSTSIRDHIEHNHLEGICIPCGLCDKTFSSRHTLSKHKSSFHK